MTRRALTPKAKAALWHEQDERCACCHEPLALKGSHADHMAPLWATQDNGTDNFQILCVPCHNNKTGRESGARAKTKRLEAIRLNGRKVAQHRLQGRAFGPSRPFDTRLRKTMAGKVERHA